MSECQTVDARLAELDQHIARLAAEHNVLHAQHEKLSAKMTANFKARKKYAEEAAQIRFDQQLASKKFDWGMLLSYEPGEANYRIQQNAFKMLSPDRHLYATGYFPESMQYGLEIRLDHSSATELDYLAQVLTTEILPAVLPIKTGRTSDKAKVIKVMEPSLSENGSYHISVYEDKVELQRGRYSRSDVVHTTVTIRDMLDYVQKNYAFGGDDDYDTEE